jgi:hypothetical protein
MALRKRWQKFTLLNVGLLLGVLASLFMVPGNTPTWLWAAISTTVVASMNYLAFARLRKVERGESIKYTKLTTLVIALGFVFFLIDLFLSLTRHSR